MLKTEANQSLEICREQKNRKVMEALLIINSILVAICLYFIKDFHGDFKGLAKNVGKLGNKVSRISTRLNNHIKSVKKELKSKS